MGKLFIAFIGLFVLASPALCSTDGLYVGAEVGDVGLTGNTGLAFKNALGFGGDVGLRANSFLDVVARGMNSSHSAVLGGPSLSLTSATVSADVRVLDIESIEVALGLGPGFYFLDNAGVSSSKFGLNYGANADAVISDAVHIGITARYHQVFSSDDYWMVGMRVGYFFSWD
jgi:hypothetical protein